MRQPRLLCGDCEQETTSPERTDREHGSRFLRHTMSGLDDHYLNITASNMDRYQKQQEESCDDVYGRLLSRIEDRREWMRDNVASGEVMEPDEERDVGGESGTA